MRIPVVKLLFYGNEEDRIRFFERAQKMGAIEFIPAEEGQKRELPASIDSLVHANRVLGHLPTQKQEELPSLDQALSIADRVNHLNHRVLELQEQERLLTQEIARVHAFGNFSWEDISAIEKHRAVQFLFAKQGSGVEVPETLLQCGSAFGLNYYISIAPERRSYEGFTEMRIDQSVGQLQEQLEEEKKDRRKAEEELKTYAKRKAFLHRALVREMNRHHLLSCEGAVSSAFDGAFFSVAGWMPKDKLDQLPEMTEGLSVRAEQIAVEERDFVPTYLENEGASRVGEDLVHIYDTPSTEDRDPSLWVLIFFSFFFAFIMGDAGYGLVLLGTSLFLSWRFMRKGGMVRRFLTLCLVLSGSCIIWGVLTTSFFGIEIPPDSPLRKVSLITWLAEKKADYVIAEKGEDYKEITAQQPYLASLNSGKEWVLSQDGEGVYKVLDSYSSSILLELAVLIGVVHVILSMLRVIDRNWAGVGWILFLVGSYLYFPQVLNATSMIHFLFGVPKEAGAAVGLQILGIGIIAAVVISIVQNRLKGLAEIATVIQIFADVLSYLRLYALALAGGMMAATFNQIGASAGIVLGSVIILIGHVVNLGLAIMGGIIHGLRLNFLEWYHYSFEGGGKMLNPLKLLKV
jgi:V/A-type H+/Na+-transporting ATPase subunit I